MPRLNRLPARFPTDTKYGGGARSRMRRLIEYPDGSKWNSNRARR